MNTPHRLPKALILIGTAAALAGWAFKLNHFMGAPQLFNVGIALVVCGMVWWAVSMLRNAD